MVSEIIMGITLLLLEIIIMNEPTHIYIVSICASAG